MYVNMRRLADIFEKGYGAADDDETLIKSLLN
jgi:hypothetical protein